MESDQLVLLAQMVLQDLQVCQAPAWLATRDQSVLQDLLAIQVLQDAKEAKVRQDQQVQWAINPKKSKPLRRRSTS